MPSSATSSRKHESSVFSGSVFLITSNGRMLSLPIPANSPRDPLNWSVKKRVCAYLTIAFFSVVGLVVIQGAILMYEPLAKEFTDVDIKPFYLDTLVSAPTLFLGIGVFLWIPLSLAIGRRPVFLLSNLTLVSASLWAGLSRNFYQLLAAICLLGLATGAALSVGLLMTIDLTFIHQRPRAISFLWCIGGSISLFILSLVPQMTNSGTDWRLFYLLWAIPSATSLLLAVFFYPETYFLRPAVAFDGRILAQSATEKVQIYEGWEQVPGGKELPDTPEISPWGSTGQLRLWGKTKGGWKAMMACYPQMVLCFCNPLIFWVALLNAVIFGGMMSISETYSVVLSEKPYDLPIRLIGLVNLSAAIGSLLAFPASGIMITSISRRLAMRNSGVRDAEHYLPAFVLPILSSVISVVLYGVTVKYRLHWIFIYISYAFNSFGYSSIGTANTLWVTEAFPRWAAPALVIVGGLSYCVSFGTSYVIDPWLKSQGYLKTNLELAGFMLVVGGIVVPVAFWGKSLRQFINGRWGMSEAGALRPQ